MGSLAVCSCYDGFELAEDNQHCSDLDECAVDNAGCSGTCVNTEGSFFCSCPPGFELGNDGFKCYRVVMELISRKPVRITFFEFFFFQKFFGIFTKNFILDLTNNTSYDM